MSHKLCKEPHIHETAVVRDSTLGIYTAVGPRTSMVETTFGDYSYVVNDSQIIYATIGKFCSIAAQTRLNPGNHPLHRAALHHFTYRSLSYDMGDSDDDAFFDWRRARTVTLGNDVWIGHGATVMPGVSIGTEAAVGAGAVVTKDVPGFAVAVGVPAKVIRYRFDDATRDGLLRVAWWDWPHEKLASAIADFRELSAAEFVRRYEDATGAQTTTGGDAPALP